MRDVNLRDAVKEILTGSLQPQDRRHYGRLVLVTLFLALLAGGAFALALRDTGTIDDADARRLYAYLCLAASSERVPVLQVRDELERFLGGGALETMKKAELAPAVEWLDRRIRVTMGKSNFSQAMDVVRRDRISSVPVAFCSVG